MEHRWEYTTRFFIKMLLSSQTEQFMAISLSLCDFSLSCLELIEYIIAEYYSE